MVDFTVRGAGIIGLMMAWTLIQRGFRVQVIDPYGAGAGASGGIVGALAPHMPEKWGPKKQFQFESLQLCEALWPEIDAVSGLSSGYGRVGRLQPLQNERGIALAHEREAGAQIHWDLMHSGLSLIRFPIGCPHPPRGNGFMIRSVRGSIPPLPWHLWSVRCKSKAV